MEMITIENSRQYEKGDTIQDNIRQSHWRKKDGNGNEKIESMMQNKI